VFRHLPAGSFPLVAMLPGFVPARFGQVRPNGSSRKLAWLGVTLDEQANAAGGPRISSPDSAVSVWVIPTNEELMIAQHTLALIRP
jgi:acetate kinase